MQSNINPSHEYGLVFYYVPDYLFPVVYHFQDEQSAKHWLKRKKQRGLSVKLVTKEHAIKLSSRKQVLNPIEYKI